MKNILLSSNNKKPLNKIYNSFKNKNLIHKLEEIDLQTCEDFFYDFVFYDFSKNDKNFEIILDNNNKYKYLLCFFEVKKSGCDNFYNAPEEQILQVFKKNNLLEPQRILNKKNSLGFFYFNLYDFSDKSDILHRLYIEKEGVILPFDYYITYFCMKHINSLIVDIIRDPEKYYNNPIIEFNNFVNLSYLEVYKYSELAEFCNHNVIFENSNIEDIHYCGDGKKLKKLFLTNSSFNLAEGLISNQRG